MTKDEIIKNLKENLQKISRELKVDFLSLRGSRPTVKLVEDIKVEVYEQKMTVKQLGSISLAPPREIYISVWDKNAVGAVAKAIEDANLGVTPLIDGNTVRINLPPLTEERKQELTKMIKKMTEVERIKIREGRDEAKREIDKLEEGKKITEDDKFKAREEIQKDVDGANKEIEEMMDNKIKEITGN